MFAGGSSGEGVPGAGSAGRREGAREVAREGGREGSSTAADKGAAVAGGGAPKKASHLLHAPSMPAGADWEEGWAEDADRWDGGGGGVGIGGLASNSVDSSTVWTRNSSNTTQASHLSGMLSTELSVSSTLDPRSPKAGHSPGEARPRLGSLPVHSSPYDPMEENPSFSHMLPDAAAAAVAAVAEDMMYGGDDDVDFQLTGTMR